jgi:hypothetical protein
VRQPRGPQQVAPADHGHAAAAILDRLPGGPATPSTHGETNPGAIQLSQASDGQELNQCTHRLYGGV